ncbi:GPI transamidase component Tta1 [Strigomonas culicis]|nr:GPI transamidase component Tta1 [Strigomonas culicis]|eukprot:EPY33011.1 GPI transamidase component Tta1 [Strigomonas culicis]
MAVWLGEEGLLDAVQGALVAVDERLVASQHDVLLQPQQRMLLHHVLLDPTLRPAEQLLPPAATASEETAEDVAAPEKPFRTGKEAIAALGPLVVQQQLGLPTLQHALSPDPHTELDLLALSIFHLPRAFFADSFFADDSNRNEAAPHVWCATVQGRNAFCVVTTSLTAANRAALGAEVRRAVLSVLAAALEVPNFHLDTLTAWQARRHRDACGYAVRSVAITQRALEEHPNIHIPGSVQGTYDRLYDLTVRAADEARRRGVQGRLLPPYVHAAKAADDLQLHPLMTPQLYVPWDHSIVSHTTVLLPVIVCVFLGARFMVDEVKYARVLREKEKKCA